jgi:hypothetical protein
MVGNVINILIAAAGLGLVVYGNIQHDAAIASAGSAMVASVVTGVANKESVQAPLKRFFHRFS